MEGSNRDLETLIKWKKLRTLTLDTLMHCGQIGDLESNAKGLVTLPSSPGCRRSCGVMLESMDEALHELQSMQA